MYPEYEAIQAYITSHREEILKKYETLVNLEGHFSEKENVELARVFVQSEFEAEGFKCRIRSVGPNKAGILVGVLGETRPGKAIMFLGHIDTVHYTGSMGAFEPFYVEDGKAYGPGVYDMKGGILIALYTVKALNHIGFDACPIKILFAGEQEGDHIGTNADEIIQEESKNVKCALCLETGDMKNRLATVRKSQHTFFMTITGTGGHAGNDFADGGNAIHEAIYKSKEIMQLTDMEKGTTVSVTSIKAGGHITSIPDLCELVIDVRVITNAERNRIYHHIDKIANTTYVKGTHTTYTSYAAKFAPLVETEDSLKFLGFLNRAAEENGLKPFGKAIRGGATDAGNAALGGATVLCACGVCGMHAHDKHECALIDSLFERCIIYATAFTKINELDIS